MQVAASPFSSSYHTYYQFHPSGSHDHELKRQYLSLLPPKQIIEICLTFDAYVPPYAKTTIWPLDLNAAIAGLQKTASSTLSESSGTDSQETQTASASTAQHQPTPSIQNPALAPTYPFGYPQVAYPHAPYHASGYPYPYAYPPPVQNGLQSSPPHTAPYGGGVPQHASEHTGNDDLPSYEEMIVEALSECTDPDGWVPKELFTWMASRYPLQSNFRPSASQALQKAFKRGRFEKSTNGKYRLSASWEGGTTTRRTTRRPQTHSASGSSATRASVPPFTHAPLVHHHHPAHIVSPGQQPYSIPPYGYPGYPGYVHQPPASTSNTPGTEPTERPNATTATGDSAAAYEAAQSILKAINFGDLLKLPPDEDEPKKEGTSQPPHAIGDGVENLLSHVQAVLASRNSEDPTSGSLQGGATEVIPPVLPSSSAHAPENNRAELQAHLALLSAQLAELAQVEESRVANVHGSSLSQRPMHSLLPDEPSSLSGSLASVSTNIAKSATVSTNSVFTAEDNASTSRPPAASPKESEESDEDDMEVVI